MYTQGKLHKITKKHENTHSNTKIEGGSYAILKF